ncbi:MAG TPA: hypothetical protein VML75_04040 [Kofleriaceae bacterium]|nr:hypothetical protein [Kofleriaceae bacterium]
MRIPSVSEIPALDRQAISDDVAPYRGMTAAELDDARNALCRMAAEQRSRWSERARNYQDPLSPQAEALWRRLVLAYRRDERSAG